nr:ribosomal lysine N-methyltransferase 3 [Ipomoea batatas]
MRRASCVSTTAVHLAHFYFILCVEWSDALELVATESSVFVRAVCDLHEGDLVAKIPKESCLTIKTCGARQMIEEAELDGYLGLAVALMYERSLGPVSPWLVIFSCCHILSLFRCFGRSLKSTLFSLALSSTRGNTPLLTLIIKEDKVLIHEDWKECIRPLLDNASLGLNPEGFGIEEYFAARSLISSRSFQIDDYHGFGMVPLADLFNHKTGAEDVHFTSISSDSESDSDADDNNNNTEYENNSDHEPISENPHSEGDSLSGSDLDSSSMSGNDPTALEMIMVKNVKAGVEVFNTYGYIGNAALLHRYGFTEPDNPYDILNLDLELVLQWSSSRFSYRHSRRRLSLWRELDCSGCVSQDSEYFEISYYGEPQIELLILLYILLLSEEAYSEVNLAVSTMGDVEKSWQLFLSKQGVPLENGSELSKNSLLTESVCLALLSLADARESLYGSNSLKKDIKELNGCSQLSEPKLYHSLMLRISERKILQKLRTYASAGATTKKGIVAMVLKRS